MSSAPKSKNTKTQSLLEAFLTSLMAGLQSALPSTTKSIVLEGQTYTVPRLIHTLQQGLTAFVEVRSAKAAYLAAVANSKPIEAECRMLAQALESWLKLQFGSTNSVMLSKFGVTVPAPKKTSAAAKAVGVAKSKATRAAKKAAALATAAPATSLVVDSHGVQLAPAESAVPALPSASSVAAK
jgi:hypothetical protein